MDFTPSFIQGRQPVLQLYHTLSETTFHHQVYNSYSVVAPIFLKGFYSKTNLFKYGFKVQL